MRFIRRYLMAASYLLVFLGAAQAQSVTIGQTAVLSAADSQNGNLLLAQSTKLGAGRNIQSLSFYVTFASGKLVLGIYDATGPNGGPGALKASTSSFTPTTGWNTAKVLTPRLIGCRQLLAGLSAEQQCSQLRENERVRLLRILQLCVWQYAEQVQRLASELYADHMVFVRHADSPTLFIPVLSQRRVRLLERSRPYKQADSEPLQRRHGLGRERQRSLGLELRRLRRRHGGTVLSPTCVIHPSIRVSSQWRVRLLEQSRPYKQADSEPLQRRHGLGRERQRSLGLELRRLQRRHGGTVLSPT